MRRLSIDYDGNLFPSPHGDLVEYRDAAALEEEVERLTRALADERDRIMKAASSPSMHAVAGGRLFGWVNPNDARKFNSGHKESCRVFKRKTEIYAMPLSNLLGPNHYQKPPTGELVTINDGLTAEVIGHVPEGLTVAAGGIEFNVTKWSWKPWATT